MVALWLLGCEKDPPPPPDPTDTDPPTTTESTGAARTGATGSIHLHEFLPDAVYGDADTVGVALFVEEAPGIANLAECLLLDAPCLVTTGSPGTEPARTDPPEGLTTVDAGPRLRVGGGFLERVRGEPGTVYTGDGFAIGPATDLAFDGQLVAFSADDAFTVPDALTGVSPDPGEVFTLGAGGDLALAWEPGERGQIELRWPGTTAIEVRVVEDSGAAALTTTELGLRPPLDATWVSLSRATHAVLDAGGNTVALTATREQWLYVDYVATDGWTDLDGSPLLAEACGATEPLPDGSYFGTLATAAGDHDLGADNPLTGYATAGRDRVFAVDLAEGDALEVEYRQVWLDAAVFVFDPTCTAVQAAEDTTFDSESETLVFTAPAAGRYQVVLDGYGEGQGERFALTTRTIPAGR
jgi:hypothetical protein